MQIKGITQPAGTLFAQPTVKAGATPKSQYGQWTERPAETGEIDGFLLQERIFAGTETEIYAVQDQAGNELLLKLYAAEHTGRLDGQARKKLPLIHSEHLPRVFRIGTWNHCAYECMEKVSGVPLAETACIPEETISKHILPQLVEAVAGIHRFGVFHNDIKPANLLWDEYAKKLFLIDFESLTGAYHPCVGLTVPFAAPEVIFSKGRVHSEKTDCCALGLTLYSLLCGRPYVPCEDLAEARRFWQKELSLPDEISTEYRILLSGLLNVNAEKRYNLADIRRWMRQTGHATPDKTPAKQVLPSPAETVPIQPLRVKDRALYGLNELFVLACEEWDYLAFLLREHQLDAFLVQFGREYYMDAQKCAGMPDPDQGLFCLLQMLRPSRQILWRGKAYNDLLELVLAGVPDTDDVEKNPVISFCQRGLLEFYYQKHGAAEEQLAEVRRLQQLMRGSPRIAVQKLHTALSDKPFFEFGKLRVETAGELVQLLLYADDALDWLVGQLMDSDAFAAWLTYQPFGAFLDRVKLQLEDDLE